MTYKTGGLLATFKDARGYLTKFAFDEQGRLAKDENAVGGFLTLERRDLPKGTEVALTTALKPSTTYRVEQLGDEGEERVNQCCCGAETRAVLGLDGSSKVFYPDGAVAERTEQPDPRWELLAPLTEQFSLTTPSGRKLQMSRERKVDLADSANLLSLKTLTDTFKVNGRVFSNTYDQGKRTLIQRTPAGRKKTTTLDEHGRAIRVEFPGIAPMRLGYDARGRLVTLKQGDGADERTMSIGYDAAGRIASLTDPLQRKVQFAYDKALTVKVAHFEKPKPDTSSNKEKPASFVAGGILIWQDGKNFLRYLRAANADRKDFEVFVAAEYFSEGKMIAGGAAKTPDADSRK